MATTARGGPMSATIRMIGCAVALAATASLGPAQAQQSQASTWCYASEADGVSLDLRISGCTIVILSGNVIEQRPRPRLHQSRQRLPRQRPARRRHRGLRPGHQARPEFRPRLPQSRPRPDKEGRQERRRCRLRRGAAHQHLSASAATASFNRPGCHRRHGGLRRERSFKEGFCCRKRCEWGWN
jgi:hypothetical protein